MQEKPHNNFLALGCFILYDYWVVTMKYLHVLSPTHYVVIDRTTHKNFRV